MLMQKPVEAQHPQHWYKVTESNDVYWGLRNNIFFNFVEGTDSISLAGFTNLGAVVSGTLKNGHLAIPRQTVHIESFGGDGPVEFDITAQGDGSLDDSMLTLRFYMKPDTQKAATGVIKAIRWGWAEQWAEYDATKPNNNRDTVIAGYKYNWVMYDLNNNPVQIGEQNDNNIKNGRWIYHDNQRRIEREVQYVNDTLHGLGIEYQNHNYPSVTRTRGVYIKGKNIGAWTMERKTGKRKWITEAAIIYDHDGNMVAKTLYYQKQGRLEMFYNKAGKMTWYCSYDKKGRLVKEGDEMEARLLREE